MTVRFNVAVTTSKPEQELSSGERALLLDAQTDDVTFDWVLIHLGLMENPPSHPDWRPGAHEIASAFDSLQRMHSRGLIAIGRTEYVDGGPPGRLAPVKHVAEPLSLVRNRVEAAIDAARRPTDWAFSCWVVATQRAAD